MTKDHKVLVIHSGGIGDLIMATPALRALRYVFPNAIIHFLGNPRSIEVIQGLSYIDKIITFDTGEIKSRFLVKMSNVFRLIWFLRKQNYNILFVLQPQLSLQAGIRMGLFTLSLGIPERYGRDTDGRGFYFTKMVIETVDSDRHEVERMLDVIRISQEVPQNYNPEIPISKDDRKTVSELLVQNAISQEGFLIAIAPGFGKPTRSWYPERWAQLGDRLIERYGANIVLIGGLKEVDLANQISNLMKEEPIIMAGKNSITQTAALLERCTLVICNDSGPMHLAAAVGANIVALFGPGDYNRIRPYGDEDKFVIVSKNIDCAPCYKVECKEHRCMKDITVDDVFQAVERFSN